MSAKINKLVTPIKKQTVSSKIRSLRLANERSEVLENSKHILLIQKKRVFSKIAKQVFSKYCKKYCECKSDKTTIKDCGRCRAGIEVPAKGFDIMQLCPVHCFPCPIFIPFEHPLLCTNCKGQGWITTGGNGVVIKLENMITMEQADNVFVIKI